MAYNPNFIPGKKVPLPKLKPTLKSKMAGLKNNTTKKILDYEHHSVVVNKDRKQAFFSACNIDGSFIPQTIPARKDNWQEEPNLKTEYQIHKSFYDTCGSIIDRGHLTKYEDPIWGDALGKAEMKKLGDSTFFFPNCSPQHRTLNRGMWKSLELYILDKQTDKNDLKICLFTGPVLKGNDPVYTKRIQGEEIQIPELFWKVITFLQVGKLYAVGFVMSQKSLLKASKLIKEKPIARDFAAKGIAFMDYSHSNPYQIKVEQLEELTGLDFSCGGKCIYPFKKEVPLKLLVEKVSIPPKARVFLGRGEEHNAHAIREYNFTNIKLL